MKRAISLMIALALVLCMVPAVFAEATEETLHLTPGENPQNLVPDTNYTLRLNLGAMDKPAGTMTWSGDVTVTVKGTQVQSPYDLANYSPKSQMIATVQAETAVNFIITLPEEEKPFELALGANAIEVPQGNSGRQAEFVATEAGEYLLGLAEGEENAYLAYITEDSLGNDMLQNVELPHTFPMDAGDSIRFNISSNNSEADTIDLVLERMTEVTKFLEVGPTKLTLLPNTHYNLRLGFGSNPNGTLAWDSNAVTVTIGEQELDSPAKITAYDVAHTIVCATVEAKTEVTFTLEEDVIILPEIVLGENNIAVPAGYDGINYIFTAPETGEYALTLMEGEENAYVSVEIGYSAEIGVEMPYIFALEEGEQAKFNISSYNGNADTIDLYFYRCCFPTDEAMVPVLEETAAGIHSMGNKALYLCLDCGWIYTADGIRIDLENEEDMLKVLILPDHAETMIDVEEVPATEEADGMKAHAYCTQCDKYFIGDETATTVGGVIVEVTRESLILPQILPYILGDVDGKNGVNIFDVTKLIYYINGRTELTDTQLLAANVDGKGDVNVFDVMKLIYIINNPQ